MMIFNIIIILLGDISESLNIYNKIMEQETAEDIER